MKLIKIIGHPIVTLMIFLLILISGKHLGGFYLLYILLGLPYGAPHSIIALGAIVFLSIGYGMNIKSSKLSRPIFYIVATGLMMLALITFFNRSEGYNDGSFSQLVPLISLCVFAISALCCLMSSLHTIFGELIKRDGRLGTMH